MQPRPWKISRGQLFGDIQYLVQDSIADWKAIHVVFQAVGIVVVDELSGISVLNAGDTAGKLAACLVKH
eukprot:1919198-Ditylum_brightwellii.AAC.1